MRAGSIEQLLSTHSGLLSPNMIQLQKRQNIFDEGEGENDFDSFDTGLLVRWLIFGAVVLVLGLLVIAYSHARRRIRMGLSPKPYHRWMVRNPPRTRQPSTIQNQFSFYRYGPTEYDMEAAPPPVYDPNHIPPPVYQPPAGASKVNPSQEYDVPPPGPPPGWQSSNLGDPGSSISSPLPTAQPPRSPGLTRCKE